MALGIFRDRIVPSAELNRHSGQVLREAALSPVTITRPRGDLVIMNRELAASMARATDALPNAMKALVRWLEPQGERSDSLGWLDSLDMNEWVDLATELAEALATPSQPLHVGRAVIHEWAESKRWLTNPSVVDTLLREEASAARSGSIPAVRQEPQV